VLAVEKPSWFQVLDLNQKKYKKSCYFVIKNLNPISLHIKNLENRM